MALNWSIFHTTLILFLLLFDSFHFWFYSFSFNFFLFHLVYIQTNGTRCDLFRAQWIWCEPFIKSVFFFLILVLGFRLWVMGPFEKGAFIGFFLDTVVGNQYWCGTMRPIPFVFTDSEVLAVLLLCNFNGTLGGIQIRQRGVTLLQNLNTQTTIDHFHWWFSWNDLLIEIDFQKMN